MTSPSPSDPDDTLLADLFRRALRADMLSPTVSFSPGFSITLRPGSPDPMFNIDDFESGITLTDAEVEAIKRGLDG